MRFGVREICDVVFRAKNARKIGTRTFYKHEPVLYFDTLKTSTLEGAVTTVYATGGRGNARLIGWDGERTLTFTMEDALISDMGIAILASAGLIGASEDKPIIVHATSMIGKVKVEENAVTFELKDENGNSIVPHTAENEDTIYVMATKNGEVIGEPFIGVASQDEEGNTIITVAAGAINGRSEEDKYTVDQIGELGKADSVLVDYYVAKTSHVTQIDIAPEVFGGNFYIEASTLFRDQVSGADMPAEFIIPNGKVQSNFTFTMASSGDPSTFTFTVDALPDYTRFNPTKKVLAAIQVIDDDVVSSELRRDGTNSKKSVFDPGILESASERV